MSSQRFLFVLLCLGLLTSRPASAQEEDFTRARESLERVLSEEKEKSRAKEDTLRGNYSAYLERAAEQHRQQGNLDMMLWLRSEQSAVKDRQPLPELAANLPGDILSMRGTFEQARQTIRDEHAVAVRELYERYRAHLENRIASLTRGGRIEAAAKAREELDRALASKPMDPELRKKVQAAQGYHYFAKIVPISVSKTMFLIRTDLDHNHETIQPEIHGDSRIVNDRYFQLEGGSISFPGAGPRLTAGILNAEEMHLVIEFIPDQAEAVPAAAIFSLSSENGTRNLALVQNGDRLGLGLRTSEHSGSIIDLGPVERAKASRVLISYQPGTLLVFRDGNVVKTDPLSGDFSTWDLADVTLGGDGVGANWKGLIRGFSIENRAVEERNLVHMARLLGTNK